MSKLCKKWILVSLELSFIVIIIFLLLTEYFETHFYPGTVINGLNVSFKTFEVADIALDRMASSYELVLSERGEIKEMIKGADIGLKFDYKYGSLSIKMQQNKTPWILSFFDPSATHFKNSFIIDEKLMNERINRLNCLDTSRIIEPRNATLVYTEGAYQIVKEVYGNKLNNSKLYSCIISAVINGNKEISLEKENCYYYPKIRSDSPKIRNTKAVAERYLTSKIIYSYAGGREIVDESEISKWIEFDDNLIIKFNTKKMKGFLYTLADHYNTCGKLRDFTTSTGTKILIGGGDYGWKVDVHGETADLIEAIINGNTIFKEPRFSQKGAVYDLNDIGLTYVEINLTKQHLWFYKNRDLLAHGDVVTGDVNDGYKTPEGIYSLKDKIKNAELKGENYRTKVSYWMPFNNNIGIHDAAWRTEFGKNIYLTRGSHGCINAPYKLAETLFNNIPLGTPVVCYY